MSWVSVAVGTPTYLADADNNTKIQVEESADENKIRFDTAGSERMIIDATGNVGIGTSSIDEKFQVEGGNIKIEAGAVSTNRGLIIANTGVTGNQTILEQYADGNPRARLHTTERRLVIEAGSGGSTGTNEKLEFWTNASRAMTIDTSQNVGIGTASPDAKLRIDQDAAATGLKVTGGSGGTNIAQFIRDVGGNASVNINASGADPQIQFVSAGNTFALGVNSNTFEIADNSSLGANTRFSITNTGNVGIGTTTPGKLLTVHYAAPAYNTVDDVLRLVSKFTSTNNAASALVGSGPAIVFAGGIGDNQTRDRARIVGVYEGSNQSGLSFHTQDTADIITEKMRLTSAANGSRLGIGTTAPIGALDVSGTTNAHTTVAMGPSTAATDKEIYLDLYRSNSSSVRQKIGVLRSGIPIAGIRGAELWSYQTLGLETANTGSGHIVFKPKGTEMMRIDASGRLLLNATTTAFGDKLYVNGDAYVTGGWRIGTGATYTGKIYNSSGIMSIETASNRDIQFGDSGTPAIMYIDTSTENVGIGTTAPQAKFQVEDVGIDTTATSTTAITQVAIDTFAAATFRSARYTIQATNSTDSTYHITEVLLIHDGTNAYITEYGTMFTGSSEGTISADIAAGNVRLLVTPASTDTIAWKVVRHSILV